MPYSSRAIVLVLQLAQGVLYLILLYENANFTKLEFVGILASTNIVQVSIRSFIVSSKNKKRKEKKKMTNDLREDMNVLIAALVVCLTRCDSWSLYQTMIMGSKPFQSHMHQSLFALAWQEMNMQLTYQHYSHNQFLH